MSAASTLESFSHNVARWAGSGGGFLTATVSLIAWFIGGRYFGYSTHWENALSIYIGIITFLLLFVMQRAQKKELSALHVKLNELIAATDKADNRVINIEEQTEERIAEVQQAHSDMIEDIGSEPS